MKPDQTAVSEAVANTPTDLQALISAVSKAMDDAMAPYLGSKGSISSLSKILGDQLTQSTSLLDYLDGNSPSSGAHKTLADYLNSGSSGASSAPKSLMDYMGGESSASSTAFTPTLAASAGVG